MLIRCNIVIVVFFAAICGACSTGAVRAPSFPELGLSQTTRFSSYYVSVAHDGVEYEAGARHYPAEALDERREGEVALRCAVTASGISDCLPTPAEQDPAFSRAALLVMQGMRIEPRSEIVDVVIRFRGGSPPDSVIRRMRSR